VLRWPKNLKSALAVHSYFLSGSLPCHAKHAAIPENTDAVTFKNGDDAGGGECAPWGRALSAAASYWLTYVVKPKTHYFWSGITSKQVGAYHGAAELGHFRLLPLLGLCVKSNL
jgi:hypothetical protein